MLHALTMTPNPRLCLVCLGEPRWFTPWTELLPADVGLFAAGHQHPDALAEALRTGPPVAVFGHGSGAIPGYELAARLRDPVHLFVSGPPGPHRNGVRAPLSCPVSVFPGETDPAAAAGWRTTTSAGFRMHALAAAVEPILEDLRDPPRALGPVPELPPGQPHHGATPPHSARAVTAGPARSPAIEALRAAVAAGETQAVPRFWARVGAEGGPLVEPCPESAAHRIVTFCYRGGPDTVRVLALVNKLTDRSRLDRSQCAHLPGTDVWHLSYRLPSTWRGSYQFAPDETGEGELAEPAGVPDPFASLVLPSRGGEPVRSIAELPDAPPQRFLWPRPGVPRGTVTETVVPSRILGYRKRAWVYTPARPAAELALLVLLDGELWADELNIAPTLDNLIAEGHLPPLLAVLPEAGPRAVRMREYQCHAPFVAFLTGELIPALAETHAITEDPARTVIAGQSLGGLTAAFAGLTAPERFGAVISQSGSFWFGEGELGRRFAGKPRLPLRFGIEVGSDERTLDEPTAQLREVLLARGYPVDFHEFSGGHDRACWRGGIAERLIGIGLR
ncbi:enterochelin esterase [Sciscionella marina]|uniref:enterochelin esterase n=1 Tax=Sciscionella marina TaxID=508770 RepID=UPI0003817571|nr:enterochelin esterase [Sciscionella marina]